MANWIVSVHAAFTIVEQAGHLDFLPSQAHAQHLYDSIPERDPDVRRSSLPRAFALGAVSLSVTLSLGACSASNETTAPPAGGSSKGGGSSAMSLSGTLNGAGSTAQEAAMQAWKKGFQTANPDVTVNYDAVGSGGGVDQFLSGGVPFAGSDAYLDNPSLKKAHKVCHGNPIEVPVYVSPIAIVYNLPGVSNLQLSPDDVAAIFAGKITKWNDPQIAADNPGTKLPTTRIVPVHRSDDSGTTYNFTDYLSQNDKADWTYPASETWPIKGGEAADGTSGVVAAVKNGAGAIGYADASQAGPLGKAAIKVGSGYVQPSQSAASKVLDKSKLVSGRPSTDIVIAVNRTTNSPGVYPIVLVSYQITCTNYKSKSEADLVKAFEQYVVSSSAQKAASQFAGSAPITPSLRQKSLAAISQIQ